MSFNLIDDAWIPVLYRNGQFKHVGIKAALTEAGCIRQIAASNPMDNVALLRFLLSVLMWCKVDAKSALAGLDEKCAGVPGGWLVNLDQNRTAFELLGDGPRFYQDASLKGGQARPIADLLVEFPGADSVNHMRHVVHDRSYGFCPACCALGILRLSVWAPANEHYPSSVNPASAAYAIALGKSLLETLGANLPEGSAGTGPPPWLSDQKPDSPDAVACLAWRSRKLWLSASIDQGVCANCGTTCMLVKEVCSERGWPTPTTAGQKFGKRVEDEFKKLNYKAKDDYIPKIVKTAPVIRGCRMGELRKAANISGNEAPSAELNEAPEREIARMFHQLISKNDAEAIKALTRNASEDESRMVGPEGTKRKKFWDTDPHLIRDGEPISLPALQADSAEHSSRFWRHALRLRHAQAGKVLATGPVVNKFTFQDAACVTLCITSARNLTGLMDLRPSLGELLKGVTPNPERQHPEIKAALVLLTPETEAWIRGKLNASGTAADDTELHEIYRWVVEQVVVSTARGSPLRRRAAARSAQDLLKAKIAETVHKPTQPANEGQFETASAKSKRARKPKGQS